MSAIGNAARALVSSPGGKLALAAASVQKREDRLTELRAKLAAAEQDDDVEGALALRREIRSLEEERDAYTLARGRAQKAHDAAEAEKLARQKAARERGLKQRLETLQVEIERQLSQLAESVGDNERTREKLIQLTGLAVCEHSLEVYAENANRKTVSRHPDKRVVTDRVTVGRATVERDYHERRTMNLTLPLVVPISE
jgi:chromosome segregation ATPase